MKIAGIIPARYSSTRFPGKPLVLIDGRTMIERVYARACGSGLLAEVVVATDDVRIYDHVESFGGKVMMTGHHHRSGTERCAEVAEKAAANGKHWDAVINIQGDEPFIDSRQIDQVARLTGKNMSAIATLVKPMHKPEEIRNPNVVKTVVDHHLHALYFSRSVIPYCRHQGTKDFSENLTYYRHIGIYGYSCPVLKQLVNLKESPLELAESLEQLRWLYHGFQVIADITQYDSLSIDTPGDLLKITNRT